MIKFVHTADTHFGVENYGRIDAKTGLHSRLADFASSMKFIVDRAISENVDLFILAGDAYKTANPTPTHQKLLLQALLRLQQHGIAVVIVVGNHDHPLSFGKAHALDVYADLPLHGFYVFAKPCAKLIQTKNGPVQVVGIPWPSRQNILTIDNFIRKDFDCITEQISTSVKSIIKDLASTLDPKIPSILTGHLTVLNGVFSGSEKRAVFGSDPLFCANDLGIEPFNYVALGHLHRYQSLNLPGSTPVVYAGSIERIDFGEVRDTKGFVLGQVDTKVSGNKIERIAEFEQVVVPTRPMIEIKLKLDLDKDLFTKQIIDEIKKYPLENSIVKLVYQIPPGSLDTVDTALVGRHLQSAWSVAGIIPVMQPATRTIRSDRCLDDDHDLSTPESLLVRYFDLKKLPQREIEALLIRAREIVAQADKNEITQE